MTISFWDLVIDRISRRLDGWKKAHLSLGGEDNFNSVLFNLVLPSCGFFVPLNLEFCCPAQNEILRLGGVLGKIAYFGPAQTSGESSR